mmetsp:Transcript_101980/g.202456  ORF Transcript_101980/g.202456 Transcript_101980/m.202456 type:complete len:277 (+) Transcript_101980:30-860(+)
MATQQWWQTTTAHVCSGETSCRSCHRGEARAGLEVISDSNDNGDNPCVLSWSPQRLPGLAPLVSACRCWCRSVSPSDVCWWNLCPDGVAGADAGKVLSSSTTKDCCCCCSRCCCRPGEDANSASAGATGAGENRLLSAPCGSNGASAASRSFISCRCCAEAARLFTSCNNFADSALSFGVGGGACGQSTLPASFSQASLKSSTAPFVLMTVWMSSVLIVSVRLHALKTDCGVGGQLFRCGVGVQIFRSCSSPSACNCPSGEAVFEATGDGVLETAP